MLRVVIFVELRKERVALAAHPNPPGLPGLGQPPRVESARRPSSSPALPTLCARCAGSGAARSRDAAAAPAMGSAPSPKAGGGRRSGGGRGSVVQPHRLGFCGEGACQPRFRED